METKKIKSDGPKEAWESGIKVLKQMEVVIPLRLLLVCNKISEKVGGDEFSIVTNIAEKDDTELTLSENFYIPKQIVTSTSIEYLPDEYKYNTVIHRHPNGCNNFSSTDHAFINLNFELSLLYTKEGGMVKGLYNLRHENGYMIQIPVVIYIDYGLEDINTDNIQKPAPLMIIEKSRKSKSKRDMRLRELGKRDWDLEPDRINPLEINPERDKLFPEESMDYGLMKDLLLDEVTGEIQDIQYRLNEVEEAMYNRISACGPF